MKILHGKCKTVVALPAACVLLFSSVASASVITFDGESFVTEAIMFAEAGDMGSELTAPTGSLTPLSSYSFGPSHSETDGIGMTTSSVSQTYAVLTANGAIQGFTLTGHAGGQFQALNEFPFSGTSASHSLFDATFSLDASAPLLLTGILNAGADSFPGSLDVLSSVRLYEAGENGQSLIYENSLSTIGSVGIEELLHLDAQTDYRLEILAQVDGVFDGTISNHYAFQSDFDLHFQIVPAPGAIALLAFAGLIGSRRRRNAA